MASADLRSQVGTAKGRVIHTDGQFARPRHERPPLATPDVDGQRRGSSCTFQPKKKGESMADHKLSDSDFRQFTGSEHWYRYCPCYAVGRKHHTAGAVEAPYRGIKNPVPYHFYVR